MRPGDTWGLNSFPSAAVPQSRRVPGEALAAAARAYLGAPWRHGGRDRFGMDCVGLVLAALRDAGAPVEDVPAYPLGLRGEPVQQAIMARGARRLHLDAAQPGDLLTFADGRYEAHLGWCSRLHGRPAVVHAHAQRRKVVEELLHGTELGGSELYRALRGAWRWPVAEPVP